MKSVICAVVVVLVSQCQGQLYPNPMCTTDPTSTVGPNDPRLPQVLPPSFQVHIEATMIERKESLTADEYVDISAGMSSMVIRQMGQVESLILNYNTNESYHIVNQQCTVQNQALDPNDVFIGGSVGNSKIPHTYSTGTVLRFAQKYGEVYKGQSTIRGISTDHWQSCMYWPFLNVNFTLDYYFTRQNWTTADGSPQIPVRAEVQGYNNLLGPGLGSSFHHIYDYVGFMSYVQDPTVFQTPKGIPCPGRAKTRQMPALKPQFQYREEITSVTEASVTQADIWYDFNYHLVRFDYRPTYYAYLYYSLDAVTEIHDFNTGVAYVIDKTFGNCSIVPIEKSTWDASRNVSQVPLHLKSPEQLFNLDSTYAYAGQRTVRGIYCDVFSTIKTNYSDGGLMGMNVSFEVYFMSNIFTSSSNVGPHTTSQGIPVRMEISEPTTGYDVIFDVFDFDQEHLDIDNTFDISPCFTDQQQYDFQITFPGYTSDLLLEYRRSFETTLIFKIASLATISPLRVQNVEIHWNENSTFFLGILLDKPPTLAKFRRSPNMIEKFSNDQTVPGVTDASTCAIVCDNQYPVACNSFDYCPQDQTCTMSSHYTTDGQKLTMNKICNHYSRVLSGPVDREVSLNDAYDNLRKAVFGGNCTVSVTLESEQKNVTLQASAITDKIWKRQQSEKDKYPSQLSILYKFKLSPNKQVFEHDALTQRGVSVEDCGYLCQNELVFTCNSFEYQANTSTCVLSPVFPDQSQNLIQTFVGSDLYTRDYTLLYMEDPHQLLSDHSSPSLTLHNTSTPNACAMLCTLNSTILCRSFNYSPSTNTCILYSMLFTDVPPSEVLESQLWNHYSIDYSKMFRKILYRELNLKEKKKIEQTTVQDCARQCVDETSFFCDSFTQCDGNVCRLYTESLYDTGHVPTVSTLSCFIFNREYYPDGRRYLPHAVTETPAVGQSTLTPVIGQSTPTTVVGQSTPTTVVGPTTTKTTVTTHPRTTASPGLDRPITDKPGRSIETTIRSKISSQPSQCSPVTAAPCVCVCKAPTYPSTSTGDHTALGQQSPGHKSSYPTGTVVGLAIAMLAVGIIIGVATVLLKQRYQQQAIVKTGIVNPVYSPSESEQ